MNVLDSIKRSLILFYLGFPLILISTLLFVGVGLGNVGLLFLSAGHVVIVPLAVTILHLVTQFIPDFSTIKYSEIGLLVPSTGISSSTVNINVFPSYWISHFTFFCSYIFFNAYTIYKNSINDDTIDDTTNKKSFNKTKSRAILIMLFTLFTFVAFVGIRYKITHTEKILGMLLGIGAMGGLGYGWYLASISINIKRMDIFGVTQQMKTVTDVNAKKLCVKQN